MAVGRTGDKHRRRHRQVDRGAIEVERIPRQDHQPHHRLTAPQFSILSSIRGSDSEEEVPSTMMWLPGYLANKFKMLSPLPDAIVPSTTTTKRMQVI